MKKHHEHSNSFFFDSRHNLLEWFIGCGPTSLTIAVSEQKVQEFDLCATHEARCLGITELCAAMEHSHSYKGKHSIVACLMSQRFVPLSSWWEAWKYIGKYGHGGRNYRAVIRKQRTLVGTEMDTLLRPASFSNVPQPLN